MFFVFFILSTALFMTIGMIQINKIFKKLNIVKKRRRKRSKKLKSLVMNFAVSIALIIVMFTMYKSFL